MWIDSEFYKRLLNTLTSFSEGEFEFDEDDFNPFMSDKYTKITKVLKEIRDTSNENIETTLDMLSSIEMGVPYKDCPDLGFKGDFLTVQEEFNSLIQYLENISLGSEKLKNLILERENTDTKIYQESDLNKLNGIWLENAITLNKISVYAIRNITEITHILSDLSKGDLAQMIEIDKMDKISEIKEAINVLVIRSNNFLNNIEEIRKVLTSVIDGDLTRKISYEFDGETLALKGIINEMITQLAEIVSEITRVAMEVGTDNILGGQAKVHKASGTWLDLTNNINKMSKSLADFDRENKKQNWIKDGVAILSKEILYEDSILEQFHIGITQTCRYINAARGVLYFFNPLKEELELVSHYAYENISEAKKTIKLGEGVIGQVGKDQKPICFTDHKSNTVIKTGTAEYSIKNIYTSPLVFKERLIGVIEIASFYEFSEYEIEFLENAVSVLSGSFYTSIQTRNNKKLELISKTDALTGLNNRGYFNQIMPEILNNKKKNDELVNFAILDIDHFKVVNDTYGHNVGDIVLQNVANVIKDCFKRKEDYCFRIGGEEFAVCFNSLDIDKSFLLMKRIKDRVEALEMRDNNGNALKKITISIGVICERATEIKNVDILFKKADSLLYKAKRDGRNMIKIGGFHGESKI